MSSASAVVSRSDRFRSRRTSKSSEWLLTRWFPCIPFEPQGLSPFQMSVAQILQSPPVKLCMISAVLLSVGIAIYEVDRRAADEAPALSSLFINYVCFGVFTLEVGLCMYVSGLAFFADKAQTLNLLLLMVDIALELVDNIIGVASFSSYVRLLRTARLGRFVRILLFSRECYMLAYGLSATLKGTMWATVFLSLVLTGWSTLAVEFIHPLNASLFEDGVYGDCAHCENAFRSVMRSNLTFFQTIIAGDSWGQLALPIIKTYPWAGLLFLSVFVTINFGLLNLILAVIVDKACEARKEDEIRVLHDKTRRMEELKGTFSRMCQAMDTDRSGYLTPEEIIQGYEEEEDFRTILKLMDVTKNDLTVLSEILDADNDGKIDYEEFCTELYKMRTENEHTIIIMTKHMVRDLQQKVAQELTAMSQELLAKAAETERKVDSLVSHLLPEQCERLGMCSGVVHHSIDTEPSPPTRKDNDALEFPRLSDSFGQGALSSTSGLTSILRHIDREVRSELEMLHRRVEKDLELSMKEFAKRALDRSNVNPWAPIYVSTHDAPPQVRDHSAMISPQQLSAQVCRTIDGQVVHRMVAPSVTAEGRQHSSGHATLPLSSCGIPKCCGTKGVDLIVHRSHESTN